MASKKNRTREEKDKDNAYHREYYKKNKVNQMLANDRWRRAHPEVARAYRARESTKEYNREWKRNNIEKVRGYWKTNNDKVKAARALRKLNQSSESECQSTSSPCVSPQESEKTKS